MLNVLVLCISCVLFFSTIWIYICDVLLQKNKIITQTKVERIIIEKDEIMKT